MKPRQRILVVGSGIAGLIAALQLSTRYAVTLVTKSELAESNTRWAQGGIAAAMFPDDSVAEPPLRMAPASTVPPERTTSGSPAEMFRPLLVTPEETVMVIVGFLRWNSGVRGVDAR